MIRLAARTVLCLTLGAAMTLAAAWACTVWVARGAPVAVTPEASAGGLNWRSSSGLASSGFGVSDVWVFGVVDMESASGERIAEIGDWYRLSAGVPFRSFAREVTRVDFPESPELLTRVHDLHPQDWRAGLVIPIALRWRISAREAYLPIRPLWPGFAGNTLVYGAAAMGLWVLVARTAQRTHAAKAEPPNPQ